MVQVGSQFYEAIMDTGSTLSFIREEAARSAASDLVGTTSQAVRLQLADGSDCVVDRCVSAMLTLGPTTARALLYIMPQVPVDIILGLDFMMERGVQLDPSRRCLYFRDFPAH